MAGNRPPGTPPNPNTDLNAEADATNPNPTVAAPNAAVPPPATTGAPTTTAAPAATTAPTTAAPAAAAAPAATGAPAAVPPAAAGAGAPPPPPAAGTDANAAAAEADRQRRKRKADQDLFQEQGEAYSYFMQEKYRLEQWQRVVYQTDGVDANGRPYHAGDPVPLPPRVPGQASATSLNPEIGLLPNGVYRHPQHLGTELRFEDGKVTPTQKIRSQNDFEKFINASIDFLAVGRGAKSIVIDWPDMKFVTEKRLLQAMDRAEQKGVAVQFGPNVQKYLASKRKEGVTKRHWRTNEVIELTETEAEGRRTRITDRQKAVNDKAATQQKSAEYQTSAEIYKHKKQKTGLEGKQKLPGDTVAAKIAGEAAYATRVFAGLDPHPPTGQRAPHAAAVQKELTELQARADVVRTGKDNFEAAIDRDKNKLAQANQATAPEIAGQLGRTSTSGAEYMTELKKEYIDLRARRDIWIQRLTQVKGDYETRDPATNNPTGNPRNNLTPEEQSEYAKTKQMLADFQKSLNGINPVGKGFTELDRKVNSLQADINTARARPVPAGGARPGG